jgi:hypothetical protein
MTDFKEREKIVKRYENWILPSIINQTGQIKDTNQIITEKSKEISEKMTDLSETAKINIEVLKDYRNEILGSDEKAWLSFKTNYERDRTLEESLDQYNADLKTHVSPISFMAASGSTMADSSGNVRDGLFTIAANLKNIPSEIIFEQYQKDNYPENKHSVRNGVIEICPDYLNDFDDLIRDWESKNFKDKKLLIGLRSIIFGKLFCTNCKKSDYVTTDWNISGVFMKGDKHYYNAINFIVNGFTISNFPSSMIQQIIDISSNLSRIQGKLSDIGKFRVHNTTDFEIDLLFRECLSYTASALKIRKTIIKNG